MRRSRQVSASAMRSRRILLQELTAAGANLKVEADRRASRYGREWEPPEFVEGTRMPCGKAGYSSRAEANKALTRLMRLRAVRGQVAEMECRAYRCDRPCCCELDGVDIHHLTSKDGTECE